MSGIADLIERLEKLDGPSREVDAEIYIALNIPAERVGRIDRLGRCVGWWPKDGPYVSAIDVPRYTTSLDAATALVGRMLTGFGVSIETHPVYGDWWDAAIFDLMPKTIANARKQTAALAVCLALLRALQQEDRR